MVAKLWTGLTTNLETHRLQMMEGQNTVAHCMHCLIIFPMSFCSLDGLESFLVCITPLVGS